MEQNKSTDPAPEKPTSLVGKIIKWLFLVLIVATCLMAAYRKFGG
jgi:TRAP-type mannitol/chloroaromatic compound transport system permease small subunit